MLEVHHIASLTLVVLHTDNPKSILPRGKNKVYNATFRKVDQRYHLTITVYALVFYVQLRFTRYVTLIRIPKNIETFAYKIK